MQAVSGSSYIYILYLSLNPSLSIQVYPWEPLPHTPAYDTDYYLPPKVNWKPSTDLDPYGSSTFFVATTRRKVHGHKALAGLGRPKFDVAYDEYSPEWQP